MSHYHMNGAMISAYHSDDAACGGGSHTRYDTPEETARQYVEIGRSLGWSDDKIEEMVETVRHPWPWTDRAVGLLP